MTSCTIANLLVLYLQDVLGLASSPCRPHSQLLGRKNHMQALLTHMFNHRPQNIYRCGRTAIKELCAFWLCGSYVVFVELFVGFRWASSSQSTLDWKWGSLRHWRVARLLPSFGPMRILMEHHQLAATPPVT